MNESFNQKCVLCGLPGGANVGGHLVNYSGTPKDFWVHGICIVLAVRSFAAHHPELLQDVKR